MKKFVLLISVIMIFWFLLPFFSHGILNIGNISGILLFVMIILCVSLQQTISYVIRVFVTVVTILAVILALADTIGMIYASHIKPEDDDTMIILGGSVNGRKPSRMLADRLKTASDYLNEHPDMIVIVSGGEGEDEDTTEADAMETWLRNHGVTNLIYKEDQSTTTDENIHFSKELIQEKKLNQSVAVVTDGFHEYRAYLLCQRYGLTFHACPVKTDFFLFPAFYARELLAIFRQWIIRLLHL